MNRSEAAKLRAIKAKEKYGPDYHQKIGRLGGKKSVGGGFTGDPERAKEVGSWGGRASVEKYGKDWLNKRSLEKRKEKQHEQSK